MKRRVLFLCTGNSARSQMAEGLLRHLVSDRFEVNSAGTHPVGLNPGAIESMHEIGVDISQHRSKKMSEFMNEPFDCVITVCDRAKDSCPLWPHAAKLIHWSFEDPAEAKGSPEERQGLFQKVRNEIRARIEEFIRAPQ